MKYRLLKELPKWPVGYVFHESVMGMAETENGKLAGIPYLMSDFPDWFEPVEPTPVEPEWEVDWTYEGYEDKSQRIIVAINGDAKERVAVQDAIDALMEWIYEPDATDITKTTDWQFMATKANTAQALIRGKA